MLIFGFCHSRLRAQLPRGRQGVKDEEGSMPTICGICRHHHSIRRMLCAECGEYFGRFQVVAQSMAGSLILECAGGVSTSSLILCLCSGRREVVSLIVVFLKHINIGSLSACVAKVPAKNRSDMHGGLPSSGFALLCHPSVSDCVALSGLSCIVSDSLAFARVALPSYALLFHCPCLQSVICHHLGFACG